MTTVNLLLDQYYAQSFCADEQSADVYMFHIDKYIKDLDGSWSHVDMDSSEGNDSGGGGGGDDGWCGCICSGIIAAIVGFSCCC